MPKLRSLIFASAAVGALVAGDLVAGTAAAQTTSPAATQGSDLSKSGLVG
jgi:hypothetical protein